MSRAFTLRRASVNDVDLLLELREAMWQEGAAEIDSADASEALENARMYFEEKVPSGEYVCFLAEAHGRVVGVGGMFLYRHPPRPHSPRGIEGYILNMLTVSEWRRKGIASAIMGELLACAREAGAVQVALRASEDGRRVYEKFGFESNPHYMQMALE
jgi:GNAT superfamily N-acetyltransferase